MLVAKNEAASAEANADCPRWKDFLHDALVSETVADVRFVMAENHCEAVYIDGELFFEENAVDSIPIGMLADVLKGRPAKITNVTLSDDWTKKTWPASYEELIPFIERETFN